MGSLVPYQVFWGERLQLAREFRGLTQQELGEKVAASPALISLCENGKKRSPVQDLVEACASALGFAPEFFFVRLEDVFREEECNFRHRRSTPERMKNQIRAHATLIGIVIDRLRFLFRFPALDLPHVPAGQNPDAIEAAAEHSRKHWKLDLDAPIMQIGRVMEHAGVVIVPHLVRSLKVDAFSRYGRTSVIFLNKVVPSASRWHFDIAHECGHLVMHPGIPTGTVETEKAADRFASAFLLPRRAFAREFGRAGLSWTRVFELKRRWFTSASAIVRRAYDLGLIDAVEYRLACQYMSAKRWTRGEPYEPAFQEPELLAMALNGLGNKVNLKLDQLAADLMFTRETFQDVTGISVPSAEKKSADLIPFQRTTSS
jgi:Zn-dependent peptidase ImmA (M78 family)/DNA-binding XRE family transcriptional regulator